MASMAALPKEVRLRIYQDLFSTSSDIKQIVHLRGGYRRAGFSEQELWSKHLDFLSDDDGDSENRIYPCSAQILRCASWIRDEALPMLYSSGIFDLRFCLEPSDFLASIGLGVTMIKEIWLSETLVVPRSSVLAKIFSLLSGLERAEIFATVPEIGDVEQTAEFKTRKLEKGLEAIKKELVEAVRASLDREKRLKVGIQFECWSIKAQEIQQHKSVKFENVLMSIDGVADDQDVASAHQ